MIVTAEQQKKVTDEWLDIFGQLPEQRQPGDLTAGEIADLWKIDRNTVYKAVKKGTLKRVKVIDETTGKSIDIYRINHDLERGDNDKIQGP